MIQYHDWGHLEKKEGFIWAYSSKGLRLYHQHGGKCGNQQADMVAGTAENSSLTINGKQRGSTQNGSKLLSSQNHSQWHTSSSKTISTLARPHLLILIVLSNNARPWWVTIHIQEPLGAIFIQSTTEQKICIPCAWYWFSFNLICRTNQWKKHLLAKK